ncbi:hypothetical protein [Roseicitreum antarcticum]|uniref:DUF115 domain-containing protein n=1 Tax=Roseicitreum antarcticum TaxID=564137 RepID=A0A1H3CQJ8_9RHOB|nr:hypothetical protein [Roseicitreum antarcticum]SDX56310.1 hypothetical protein SAMN04488238_11018 [Roseicitreum antarcticum]
MSDIAPPGNESGADAALARCRDIWDQRGFVPLAAIYTAAAAMPPPQPMDAPTIVPTAQALMRAFNGARQVQAQIARAARSGDPDAAELAAALRLQALDRPPCRPIAPARALALEARLIADPPGYLAGLGPDQPYPAVLKEEYLAFDADWTRTTLAGAQDRLARFIAARRQDTAVLVGNGPSLARLDRRLLEGQDVYISNYAIRDAGLHRLARGVAVSNAFVARQAPHLFQTSPLWKFHPLWLGDTLGDTPRTVYLNALGGDLFFAPDVAQKIAWHATVTFFWLQILYAAGYRKVCLVGVDNAYQQRPGAREGDLITQTAPDENHFDPEYFRGKVWQAADPDHMAQTYALARQHYDACGREIVNCTQGGNLEVFRRAALADELPAPVRPAPVRPVPVRPAPATGTDALRRAALLHTTRALLAGPPRGGATEQPGTAPPHIPVPQNAPAATNPSPQAGPDITQLDAHDPVRQLTERVQQFLQSGAARPHPRPPR